MSEVDTSIDPVILQYCQKNPGNKACICADTLSKNLKEYQLLYDDTKSQNEEREREYLGRMRKYGDEKSQREDDYYNSVSSQRMSPKCCHSTAQCDKDDGWETERLSGDGCFLCKKRICKLRDSAVEDKVSDWLRSYKMQHPEPQRANVIPPPEMNLAMNCCIQQQKLSAENMKNVTQTCNQSIKQDIQKQADGVDAEVDGEEKEKGEGGVEGEGGMGTNKKWILAVVIFACLCFLFSTGALIMWYE